MIIERQFINTGKDRPLRTKAALQKMKDTAIEFYQCDFIASVAYIGNGVYTVILCTHQPQEN